MDVEAPVGDVPVLMQLRFQQSKLFENLEMPQIQFIDRELDITEIGAHSAKLCRRP